MICNPLCPLWPAIAPALLAACISPGLAMGYQPASAVPLSNGLASSSLTSAALSSVVTPGEGQERVEKRPGELRLAHEGRRDAHATGTVNTIQYTLNISHNPIPDLGWPAVTMDFAVAPSVDLRAIKPGVRVNFTIEQAQGGMYEVRTITPGGDR